MGGWSAREATCISLDIVGPLLDYNKRKLPRPTLGCTCSTVLSSSTSISPRVGGVALHSTQRLIADRANSRQPPPYPTGDGITLPSHLSGDLDHTGASHNLSRGIWPCLPPPILHHIARACRLYSSTLLRRNPDLSICFRQQANTTRAIRYHSRRAQLCNASYASPYGSLVRKSLSRRPSSSCPLCYLWACQSQCLLLPLAVVSGVALCRFWRRFGIGCVARCSCGQPHLSDCDGGQKKTPGRWKCELTVRTSVGLTVR